MLLVVCCVLRSGSAHSNLPLAVEVRDCPLRSGDCCWERRRSGGGAQDTTLENLTTLTGGEPIQVVLKSSGNLGTVSRHSPVFRKVLCLAGEPCCKPLFCC